MKHRLVAEAFGTFALVFAGCGAIVVNDLHGSVTHVGIALTFGLVVLALIYALGDVSGAHLNPAVTAAFAVAGRFPAREVLPYAAAQCIGAVLGAAFLLVLFPSHPTLGATRPAGPAHQSLLLELALTLLLMAVVLRVSTGAKEKGISAGVAVGGVIALEALFAGPVCGASMNPARSLGPALVSGHGEGLRVLWMYLLAPMVGAAAAVGVCKAVSGPEPCCPPVGAAS